MKALHHVSIMMQRDIESLSMFAFRLGKHMDSLAADGWEIVSMSSYLDSRGIEHARITVRKLIV